MNSDRFNTLRKRERTILRAVVAEASKPLPTRPTLLALAFHKACEKAVQKAPQRLGLA